MPCRRDTRRLAEGVEDRAHHLISRAQAQPCLACPGEALTADADEDSLGTTYYPHLPIQSSHRRSPGALHLSADRSSGVSGGEPIPRAVAEFLISPVTFAPCC